MLWVGLEINRIESNLILKCLYLYSFKKSSNSNADSNIISHNSYEFERKCLLKIHEYLLDIKVYLFDQYVKATNIKNSN